MEFFSKKKTGFYRDLPGSRISEGNPGPVPDPGKFEKVNPGPGQIPGFSIPGPGSRFDPVPLPIPGYRLNTFSAQSIEKMWTRVPS